MGTSRQTVRSVLSVRAVALVTTIFVSVLALPAAAAPAGGGGAGAAAVCEPAPADPACSGTASLENPIAAAAGDVSVAAGYPVKPEAPAPPRAGAFTDTAVVAARTRLVGKGVYLCNEVSGIDGPSCEGGGVRPDAQIVDLARGLGVKGIWVRCGDSRRGFPAAHKAALSRFVPQAHAAGMYVICWDVPNFWNLQEDARRTAEMSLYSDAVASDLESGGDTISCSYASEGCGYAGPELEADKGRRWASAFSGWTRYYLGQYLGASGDDYPMVVITMQPQTHAGYPFEELAAGFNVFSPMAYRGTTWFNNGDPNQGEVARAGNPFVPTAYSLLRSRGAGDGRHDIVTTGMAYGSGPPLYSAPNQIATDMSLSEQNGGLGFSAFVFQGLLNHADWAGVFSSYTWLAAEAIVPYAPAFGGGVYAAIGQVEAGGDAEIVTGPGAGGGPHVRVLRRDGTEVAGFYAYNPGFAGGVNVATCDVDGDGGVDIVTGPGPGGGPHVRVLSLAGGLHEIAGFYAYDPAFGGGVNVACADVDGDGTGDIITAPITGGGPHVRAISLSGGLHEVTGFYAYTPLFTGGVTVAACDVDGDGRADVVTGPGPGGGPHVRVLSLAGGLHEIAGFYAYTPAFGGGVNVGCGDLDGDGRGDLVTGPGAGGAPHIRVLSLAGGLHELWGWYAVTPTITRGVRPAVGDVVAGGAQEIAVAFGPGRPPAVVLRNRNGSPI